MYLYFLAFCHWLRKCKLEDDQKSCIKSISETAYSEKGENIEYDETKSCFYK